MTASQDGLNRRVALGLMGGAVAASSMSSRALAGAHAQPDLQAESEPQPMLDLTDRGDFLTAIVKMRGSTDGGNSMGWVRGTRYASVDNLMTPMWNILAGTFFRYSREDENTYDIKSIEVAYFTDLETNKLIETWYNPFTDTTIDVPQTRMGPSTIKMTADGLTIPNPAGEASGLKISHQFKPAVMVGDDVWITEEIQVDGGPPKKEGMQRFAYNEVTTYHSTMAELSDPANTSVPAQVHFNGSVSFRPWMGFGDMVGHTIARGAGRHIKNADEFDPYYVELTKQYHPDVLNDIDGVLDAAK